jgi:hypothetical protein
MEMLEEAKAQAEQAKDYVMNLNDKADQAVDAKIEQLQAAINDIQAKLDQAKQSRFTWAIVVVVSLLLLGFGVLVVTL